MEKNALISDLAALLELFVVKCWLKKRKENFECTKADAAANIRDLYLESLHKKKNLPPFQLSSISLQSFRFNLFLFHFSSFDFLSSTPSCLSLHGDMPAVEMLIKFFFIYTCSIYLK